MNHLLLTCFPLAWNVNNEFIPSTAIFPLDKCEREPGEKGEDWE